MRSFLTVNGYLSLYMGDEKLQKKELREQVDLVAVRCYEFKHQDRNPFDLSVREFCPR